MSMMIFLSYKWFWHMFYDIIRNCSTNKFLRIYWHYMCKSANLAIAGKYSRLSLASPHNLCPDLIVRCLDKDNLFRSALLNNTFSCTCGRIFHFPGCDNNRFLVKFGYNGIQQTKHIWRQDLTCYYMFNL